MKAKAFITPHACMLFVAVLALSSFASAQHEMQKDSASNSPNLFQLVRAATQQYLNVNNATPAGYSPILGCVTGPDHGAMGIHYVNLSLFASGEIDVSHPQALIYEPLNGQRRLVGVEYFVDAATYLANHNGASPILEGQLFQYIGSPNRYNLNPLFELHVWAWRANPQGAYVDWNNEVTCTGE